MLHISKDDNMHRITRREEGKGAQHLADLFNASPDILIRVVKVFDTATPQPATDSEAPEAGADGVTPEDYRYLADSWKTETMVWRRTVDRLRTELATVMSNHKQTLTALAIARDMLNESGEELSTVTAERDLEGDKRLALLDSATTTDMDLAKARTDLTAEREAHTEDKALLDSAMFVLKALRNSLKDEKQHADGLAGILEIVAGDLHSKENHEENYQDCNVLFCIDEIAILHAHDARRSEGGEA